MFIGAVGGLICIIITIVVVVCVIKKRGNADNEDLLYGSALESVSHTSAPIAVKSVDDAIGGEVDPLSLSRASMPPPIAAAQFDEEGNPIAAPQVPDVAPPVNSEQYGKLPSAPLTSSPDAAPENYAQISNVMLPGVAAPEAGGYMEHQAHGSAPAPPRPEAFQMPTDLPPPPP